MRGTILLGGLALALGGCGARGEEDFAIAVQRPVATMFTMLGSAAMPEEARALFPGLKVERTRPSENEVLYTIPGDGDFPATIRFRFDGSEDGRATTVHGFVDVPPIKVALQGTTMVLSEAKVERALQTYLARAAKSGDTSGWGASPMPETLLALAIATNSKVFADLQEMQKNPAKFASRLGDLDGMFGSDDDVDMGEPALDARPQSDPDRDAMRVGVAQSQRAAVEEEARQSASAPMDRAEGQDVSPGSY